MTVSNYSQTSHAHLALMSSSLGKSFWSPSLNRYIQVKVYMGQSRRRKRSRSWVIRQEMHSIIFVYLTISFIMNLHKHKMQFQIITTTKTATGEW